jgi:hypothetical protein
MDVGSLVVTLSVQANQFINEMKNAVAPFTGAWIET